MPRPRAHFRVRAYWQFPPRSSCIVDCIRAQRIRPSDRECTLHDTTPGHGTARHPSAHVDTTANHRHVFRLSTSLTAVWTGPDLARGLGIVISEPLASSLTPATAARSFGVSRGDTDRRSPNCLRETIDFAGNAGAHGCLGFGDYGYRCSIADVSACRQSTCYPWRADKQGAVEPETYAACSCFHRLFCASSTMSRISVQGTTTRLPISTRVSSPRSMSLSMVSVEHLSLSAAS